MKTEDELEEMSNNELRQKIKYVYQKIQEYSVPTPQKSFGIKSTHEKAPEIDHISTDL